MWIKKFHRDQIEDKPSPIPTQVVSNEEFLPTPQTKQQKQVEALIQTLASQYGKKTGLNRRDFLKTSSGMAVAFLAMNQVFGKYFSIHAEVIVPPLLTTPAYRSTLSILFAISFVIPE